MVRLRFICVCFAIAAILSIMFQMPAAIAADDATVKKAAVTIEAGKTGEPISKYIFGQFVEHQGRCIYGGVWAEMLEDRKFYYPVGAEKSPWRPIGSKEAVMMVTDNSYVGEHTPKVKLAGQTPCGIVQAELALREGRKYEGHIVLAGSSSAKVQVSLQLGEGANEKQTITIDNLTNEYTRTPLSFTAGGDTDNGRFEITGSGGGSFNIGVVSLMPADNIHGMRADTIKLLRELNAAIYRWPGGLFVNYYDWRDGIGERDKRPPRLNAAYAGDTEGWVAMLEMNDFGLDEFMRLCSELGTEAYMIVNAAYGDEYSAAAEVEYFNGPEYSPMGSLRAANGHPEPYTVKFWGIGNEMWEEGYLSLNNYIRRHNMFADKMRQADPSIKLVAVGDQWSEAMLRNCAEHMDFISEHFYAFTKETDSVLEHAQHIPGGVREIAGDLHRFREQIEQLRDTDIRIALDEWNYFWGGREEIYGEAAPRYFFRDALGIAMGLQEMFRNSDVIYMANAHPVNVHGQIKTTKTEAAFEVTGLVFKIYSRHFGRLPVAVAGDIEPLDVAAAWTDGRKALTVGIVNATDHKYEITMALKEAQLTGEGRLWLIVSSDPMAYNEPGKPPQVVIEVKQLSGISRKLNVPPLSINLYELPVK